MAGFRALATPRPQCDSDTKVIVAICVSNEGSKCGALAAHGWSEHGPNTRPTATVLTRGRGLRRQRQLEACEPEAGCLTNSTNSRNTDKNSPCNPGAALSKRPGTPAARIGSQAPLLGGPKRSPLPQDGSRARFGQIKAEPDAGFASDYECLEQVNGEWALMAPPQPISCFRAASGDGMRASLSTALLAW